MAPQPISIYKVPDRDYAWLRVCPLTEFGAPARGAIVRLNEPNRIQSRIVDAGSGYLCQMEPVAHFGLGTDPKPLRVEVRWPDGATRLIERPEPCSTLVVAKPSR